MTSPLDAVRRQLGLESVAVPLRPSLGRTTPGLTVVARASARPTARLDDDVRLALLAAGLAAMAVASGLPFVVPALAQHPSVAGARKAAAVLSWPNLLVPVIAAGSAAVVLLALSISTRGYTRVGEVEGYLALVAAVVAACACVSSLLVIVGYIVALAVVIALMILILIVVIGVLATFLAG